MRRYPLPEDCIQKNFLKAYNQLLVDRKFIAEKTDAIMECLMDTTAIETEAVALREEIAVVDELIRQAIAQNASLALNQDDYQQRYNSLVSRNEAVSVRLAAIEAECAARKAQRHSIDTFLESLMSSEKIVTEFTPALWNAVVDHATINEQGIMTFTIRNQHKVNA